MHENVVLTASIDGKTRLWTLSEEQIKRVQAGTGAYRHFRQARAELVRRSKKHQQELLRTIDGIEKILTQEPFEE